MAKEFVQMRRDPTTMAMLIGIPLVQLILFGFAINMDPKNLPTAVLNQDQSQYSRQFLYAMENTRYFHFIEQPKSEKEASAWLKQGKVLFVVNIPAHFEKDVIRGREPSILVEADATDPGASGFALASLGPLTEQLFKIDSQGVLKKTLPAPPPFKIEVHAKYNPLRITQFNIVPGLLGVVLTMTMVMITAISITKENERGTIENLLFVARLYQLDNKKECVKAILESFGLTERKDQLTGTLSGGWKQRVALAACLLHKPTLLLLDEPTAGVDPKARRVFWSHIHELSREGVTTLVSTHYMDEAAHCNRLAYLAQGELIVQGTTTDIISHAKLSAYEVKGEKLPLLLDCLEKIEGVEEITLLEDRLHITGKKSELTTQILKQVLDKKMVSIQSVPPLLEDAFISLVNQSELPYEG
jgi:ABC-type uncharacterized transport system ATPase subunit